MRLASVLFQQTLNKAKSSMWIEQGLAMITIAIIGAISGSIIPRYSVCSK